MAGGASSRARRLPALRPEAPAPVVERDAGEAFLSGLAGRVAAELEARLCAVSAAPALSSQGRAGEPAVLRVGEAAEVLGISRALAYELVRRGELPSVRLGRRIVVPRIALEQLLASTIKPVPVRGEPIEAVLAISRADVRRR